MRTVSFQGAQLTSCQKRRLAEQQQVQNSFINPVLAQQVEQTLRVVEARKEQGVKPERIWFVERQETGTTCIAEWMGF
ncbi:hypothetical protein RGV33_16800 [Pseudomonas sp. Bout1]|uniref:hypothetical protein n=1 Tax=Pseudomonas sp. Bout1 TaxID=3048600 RepID=UPI002AB4B0F4|nr:hypothetical protein [Pseudomonas sp. Bout1]MDY7533294.1 hypothetical protein [Pseudomonas sp. Bout1]MDY7533307.1 hypothetical protein [Pseudomonas sp. Bout1]MDY7533320.1 hypothetical protein [Pseudomonas sp. Bout1]MEB0189361.1 hypothetical protein [Pseudomonas sp. Bout1]